MIERIITVQIPDGLEARPTALFVQTASKFNSHVYVEVEEKKVNAKSIMGMMSLGIMEGQKVTISAEGSDAQQAVDELSDFLLNKHIL